MFRSVIFKKFILFSNNLQYEILFSLKIFLLNEFNFSFKKILNIFVSNILKDKSEQYNYQPNDFHIHVLRYQSIKI